MLNLSKTKKVRHVAKIDTLIDEIKDEIDRLHEIANPKRKLEAARDLVEYITLHHIDYPEAGLDADR
jgi:cell fate (sporulation/competence/biofilm development) regulator YmcA (YheA/YmcA/DUF963 family)